MISDERSFGAASAVMGLLTLYALVSRVGGQPVFDLVFESLLFYLPLAMLASYWLFLKVKNKLAR